MEREHTKKFHGLNAREILRRVFRENGTKPCNQGMRRLWRTASGCATSSERLRLPRTEKRSGAVVTVRLVKRAQVAHPCKSCQAKASTQNKRIRSPHFRGQRIRIVGVKKGLVLLSRSLLCSSGLFSGCFLRGALLSGRLLRRSLTLRRPLGALFGEQFDGALLSPSHRRDNVQLH